MRELRDLAGNEGLPNPYDDVSILRRYQQAGGDLAEVIYLSLGETWSRAAPGLREALAADLPAHCHGYSLSPYGFPALHSILRTYITDTHHLEAVAALGRDYEVAVSQNSTRNAMFHFGRLLREDSRATAGRKAVVIASTPGWDYAGVYTALGFEMRTFDVDSRTHYQPDHQEVDDLLRRARRDTDGPVLLAINAQHNPTGANWDPHRVRAMIRSALATRTGMLVDDAYYAVHNPDVIPTNTLRILLEELNSLPRGQHPRWLAVRSLGKQFHCNGWGIGALTAAPDTVGRLVVRLQPQYTYVSAVPLQAAMAAWLPQSRQPVVPRSATHRVRRQAAAGDPAPDRRPRLPRHRFLPRRLCRLPPHAHPALVRPRPARRIIGLPGLLPVTDRSSAGGGADDHSRDAAERGRGPRPCLPRSHLARTRRGPEQVPAIRPDLACALRRRVLGHVGNGGVMPADEVSRMERGRALMRRISPEVGEALMGELRAVAPDFEDLLIGFAFADVWDRSVMSLRERAIVRLGALAALGAPGAAVRANIDSALHIGLTVDEIAEAFVQVLPYAGFPHVITSLEILASMREAPGPRPTAGEGQ
jgi:N-succinyldiaminopimelate aminotransferase